METEQDSRVAPVGTFEHVDMWHEKMKARRRAHRCGPAVDLVTDSRCSIGIEDGRELTNSEGIAVQRQQHGVRQQLHARKSLEASVLLHFYCLRVDSAVRSTSARRSRLQESPPSQKLFWACVRGEHAAAMDALVAKANPNCCNKDGLNSLMARSRGCL